MADTDVRVIMAEIGEEGQPVPGNAGSRLLRCPAVRHLPPLCEAICLSSELPAQRTAVANRTAVRCAYFLLRRWTRVFFSSLRCFFFAIRLRRFLMTEPT